MNKPTCRDNGGGLGESVAFHNGNADVFEELKHGQTRGRAARRHVPAKRHTQLQEKTE